MRKDRNTFFSEASMMQANMPMQPMMPGMNPYQASQASQSYYAGPGPGMMPQAPTQAAVPTNIYQTESISSTMESRLAKIERQIRRLETRVNKLEGNISNYVNTEDNDVNISNSMYMI